VIACTCLFLLAGCESKNPVYSGFCDDVNVSLPISCVKVDIKNDIILSSNFKEAMKDKISDNCPYHIEGEIYRASKCNSIEAKSIGVDFNGYVRLNIFQGNKCIYKAQSDFKNDEDAAIKRVLETLKKELF
jgi:hypothetical protein